MIKPRTAGIAFLLALVLPALLFAATAVNVNQANAATLAKSLDGIGASKAQATVTWRAAHGLFKSVDDLAQVKGIGKSTFARNREAILLAATTPTASAALTALAPLVAKDNAPTKRARIVSVKAPAVLQP